MGREMPLGAPCASLKYRNLIVTPTNLCLLCTTIRAILCAVRRILSHGWNTDETRIRRQLDALALLHPCSIRVSSVAEFGCGSTALCLCGSFFPAGLSDGNAHASGSARSQSVPRRVSSTLRYARNPSSSQSTMKYASLALVSLSLVAVAGLDSGVQPAKSPPLPLRYDPVKKTDRTRLLGVYGSPEVQA